MSEPTDETIPSWLANELSDRGDRVVAVDDEFGAVGDKWVAVSKLAVDVTTKKSPIKIWFFSEMIICKTRSNNQK